MNKKWWLDAAEVFDSWRVVPRLIVFGYCIWLPHITNQVLIWYQSLPASERTMEASGLAGAIITAVTGIAAWVFKIYSAAGRAWSGSADDPT